MLYNSADTKPFEFVLFELLITELNNHNGKTPNLNLILWD